MNDTEILKRELLTYYNYLKPIPDEHKLVENHFKQLMIAQSFIKAEVVLRQLRVCEGVRQ